MKSSISWSIRIIRLWTYKDATEFSSWLYQGSHVEYRRTLLVAIRIEVYLCKFMST